MEALLNEKTKVMVQGITGYQGRFHTKKMLDYGTSIVAGVTPGRGGETVENVPVFNTCKEACEKFDIKASIIFVPAPFVKAAVFEAIDGCPDLRMIVIITEGIPVKDSAEIMKYAADHGVNIIGPNCPGLIIPGKAKLGIIPAEICMEGNVGIVSRSGTLTYEVVKLLSNNGFGQSACVGIGGDPIHGMGFVDLIKVFNEDPQTHFIVLIGEIGGNEEIIAAEYVQKHVKKPVIAYIAGKSAPPGKQMGHAGAIVMGAGGTAVEKIKILRNMGISVVNKPGEIPELLKSYKKSD